MATAPTARVDLVEQACGAWREQIFRYLLRRVHDPDEAEELTQEVFAHALTDVERLARNGGDPLPWLHTVAHGLYVDSIRRRESHAPCVPLDDVELLEQRPLEQAPCRTLAEAVAALPPSLQRPVVLHLFEGRPFRDVALALHTTERACRTRYARAIELLQARLDELGLSPREPPQEALTSTRR